METARGVRPRKAKAACAFQPGHGTGIGQHRAGDQKEETDAQYKQKTRTKERTLKGGQVEVRLGIGRQRGTNQAGTVPSWGVNSTEE